MIFIEQIKKENQDENKIEIKVDYRNFATIVKHDFIDKTYLIFALKQTLKELEKEL